MLTSNTSTRKKPALSKIHLGQILQPMDEERLKSPIISSSPSARLKNKFLQFYAEGSDTLPNQTFNPHSRSASSTRKASSTFLNSTISGSSTTAIENSRKRHLMTSTHQAQSEEHTSTIIKNGISDSTNESQIASQSAKNSKKSPVSSYLQQYMIRLEMINLGDPEICPSGVYTMTSFTSINTWYGCIFVHHGPWKGAVFKFKVIFPQEYPYESPEIYFKTKVFHPLIRESDGKFNLKPQFPSWKAYEDYLFLALTFMKNSFKNALLSSLRLEDCYNIDAYKLYRQNDSKFAEVASSNVRDSLQPSTLYTPESPDCPITFFPLSDSQYESIKKNMYKSVHDSSMLIKNQ